RQRGWEGVVVHPGFLPDGECGGGLPESPSPHYLVASSTASTELINVHELIGTQDQVAVPFPGIDPLNGKHQAFSQGEFRPGGEPAQQERVEPVNACLVPWRCFACHPGSQGTGKVVYQGIVEKEQCLGCDNGFATLPHNRSGIGAVEQPAEAS